MSTWTRRGWLGRSLAGVAAALVHPQALPAQNTPDGEPPKPGAGRLKQSAARWCYPHLSVDELCRAGAEMGLRGIDLLQPEEWSIPRRYGLVCAMGYAGMTDLYHGINRLEFHPFMEKCLRKYLPLAKKQGVPNVILFSGRRDGMDDAQGAANCITGLNRVKAMAEDFGVTLCMELLNSKVDHPGYMCDHTAWGAGVMQAVNSPRVKLLYDIYHMQIMEGDLIRTIQADHQWIAHFHTGGVPNRHELDGHQEVRWDGVMRAILATGFQGYVAHEFVPTGAPLDSLRRAVRLCNV